MVDIYVLLGRKFFQDAARCGHWGFQVKCAPRYWELNGDGLEGVRGPTSGRKAGCSTKIYVVIRH